VLGSVAVVELLFDDPVDDLVGNEKAAVHVPLGFKAQLGAGCGRLAEQVAGGEVCTL